MKTIPFADLALSDAQTAFADPCVDVAKAAHTAARANWANAFPAQRSHVSEAFEAIARAQLDVIRATFPR